MQDKISKICVCTETSEIQAETKLGLALLGFPGDLPGDGIRILSIDGGGIRGIVVMELLKHLEEMTNKRVFELFDFICGVSTGAILVCGLAANKNLTLSEGINLYKKISYQVFHRPSTFDLLSGTSRLMWNHAYYDADLWEKLLQHHMTQTRIIDTAKYSHCPKFCCVSTTVSDEALEAHVFRNYVLPINVQSVYSGSHSARLWEVVRASSAAPAFFGDFKLNGELHQDGGILYNNPSCVAIHESKLLWPNKNIQALVSLGTGRSPNKNKIDGQKLYNQKMFDVDSTLSISSWKTKFLRILDAATDTEQTHHIVSDLMSHDKYFRFNPYLTEMVSMVEVRSEKIAQLEKDALMYFRRNEDKFEELAALLLKPKSPFKTFNDYVFKTLVN
ncbi:unnamed protein product [Diamesa hyperborea]